MLVAFAGKIGSGKDTAADYLRDKYGFGRAAFADRVKQALAIMFGFTNEQLYGREKEQVDPYWGLTPRFAMQRMATEGMRRLFGDDFWVRALFRAPFGINGHTAISDTRFLSEVEAVKRQGGIVVRLKRNERVYNRWERLLIMLHLKRGVHRSEIELDRYAGWDVVIDNNGSLDELHDMLDGLMAALDIRSM